MAIFDLPRRLVAEAFGTAFLVATVVGSAWCAIAAPSSGATAAADSLVVATTCALGGLWLVSRRVRRRAGA